MTTSFSLTAIGIDVAKDKLDVILLSTSPSRKPQHRVFANSAPGHQQLHDWLLSHQAQGIPVCMEATGRYSDAIALFLHQAGWTVQVVNPARIKKFGESELLRLKTDKSDAALIARFSLSQHPLAWTPPAKEQRQLQELVRAREDLEGLQSQQRTRLQQSADLHPAVRQAHEQVLQTLATQITELEQQIAQHIEADPDFKRLSDLLISIDGIGAKTASVLVAELGDCSRFASSRQLVAFVGLAPAERRSGSSLHAPTRLSKTGRADLRKALYFPAVTACRCNPIVRAFYLRLLAAGKPKMVALSAAMHKLLVIAYAVVRSGRPFDRQYQQTGQPPVVAPLAS